MKFEIISECDPDECFIEGCNGVYVTKVIKVLERRNGRRINVTESICNQCGDDRDERLVNFIRENL